MSFVEGPPCQNRQQKQYTEASAKPVQEKAKPTSSEEVASTASVGGAYPGSHFLLSGVPMHSSGTSNNSINTTSSP